MDELAMQHVFPAAHEPERGGIRDSDQYDAKNTEFKHRSSHKM
jgi:hypothetical protein